MNNQKYKIVLTSISAAIVLLGLVYIVIFGRALGQSENHARIALVLPKVIFGSEAVRIDDETYLVKNTPSFIKTMETRGFMYVEQLGSGYVFRKDGSNYISVSRMYSSRFMVFTYPKKG